MKYIGSVILYIKKPHNKSDSEAFSRIVSAASNNEWIDKEFYSRPLYYWKATLSLRAVRENTLTLKELSENVASKVEGVFSDFGAVNYHELDSFDDVKQFADEVIMDDNFSSNNVIYCIVVKNRN